MEEGKREKEERFNHNDTTAHNGVKREEVMAAKEFGQLSEETEKIATAILDSAFKVHRTLGPGLLESVYETCMAHELKKKGIEFESQVALPIIYDGAKLDAGLRLDLLVAKQVIVELKSVDRPNPLFEAQLMTYPKLADLRLGLLINFNVKFLKDGIQRIVL